MCDISAILKQGLGVTSFFAGTAILFERFDKVRKSGLDEFLVNANIVAKVDFR